MCTFFFADTFLVKQHFIDQLLAKFCDIFFLNSCIIPSFWAFFIFGWKMKKMLKLHLNFVVSFYNFLAKSHNFEHFSFLGEKWKKNSSSGLSLNLINLFISILAWMRFVYIIFFAYTFLVKQHFIDRLLAKLSDILFFIGI